MDGRDVSGPSADLPYAEIEDFLNRQILARNGVALEPAALIAALSAGSSVTVAAAAHVIGVIGSAGAVDALRPHLASASDLVRVEAAYALTRLGAPEGRAALIECLNLPIDAFLSPPLAAGYLARIGDPRGYPVVARCLDVPITPVRMVACKQIAFFVRFQGRTAGEEIIDALALFDRALGDVDPGVQWQALVQLRELRPGGARKLLESFLERASSAANREVAAEILAGLGPD